MNGASRHALIVGGSGLLGRALADRIATSGDAAEGALEVEHRGLVDEILSDALGGLGASLGRQFPVTDWYCAVGLVGSEAGEDALDRINHRFPAALHARLAALADVCSPRLVTFGSVLENNARLVAATPYLASKRRLLERHADPARPRRVPWLHVQLHTLYGGHKPPHPAMFAGQMFAALRDRTPFHMSAGEQLREYHHVADVAANVIDGLGRDIGDGPVVLSSGAPIRLRSLAEGVFAHFAAGDLLRIGALRHDAGEVFENDYRRSPHLVAGRDSIAGMIAWFEALGVRCPE